MKHRYFSKGEGSIFNTLSGNVQRAIETQANIDVEAHKLSKYYGHVLKDDETETGLFNMICEEYSRKSEEDLKKLVAFDSRALYHYPFKKDREEYYESLAKERAKRMDNDIYIQTHQRYKNFNDTGR